ncbi:MAG: AAA family ATPase [Desulfobacterium sp.]|nr:AAA family ATPase [Desulfobacterium sp.]
MSKNKLMIAAAGSGKTTFLVKDALSIIDKNVLITTYTEANEEEIKKKIIKEHGGCIPKNITIQTWFSFLLQHGVRPYQSSMKDELHTKKVGFYLTERQSGFRYNDKNNKPIFWGEKDFYKYYFTKDYKIYSDKISKFIIECNSKSKGELIGRIARIFPFVFVDEVQDLAGWDLEILKLIFDSPAHVSLVGDPRQVTYLTHHPRKYANYKDGKIEAFITEKCENGICYIDTNILNKSHRNNEVICKFSSALFPDFPPCKPCMCEMCRSYGVRHEGVFLIKEKDVKSYCRKYSPTILRYNKAIHPEWNYGKCKGLTFDDILIYPTDKIRTYLINGDISKISSIKAKFYVALTRARYSIGIVFDYDDNTEYIEGLKKCKEQKTT